MKSSNLFYGLLAAILIGCYLWAHPQNDDQIKDSPVKLTTNSPVAAVAASHVGHFTLVEFFAGY